MFTGIITDIGTILAHEKRGDSRLAIACSQPIDDAAIGASIACSGACLTVVAKGADAGGRPWFAVDASAETMARTAPGMWEPGRRLNLERALRVGDELGGHIVTGHVDGVGTIVAVQPTGDSWVVAISVPSPLAPQVAAKGSITVDGVSLTVNAVEDQSDGTARMMLNIIPHTRAETTLADWTAGRAVNLEVDILARYLARMVERLPVKAGDGTAT